MNRSRRRLLAAALPAIVHASRDVDDYNKHRRSFVISLVPPPPDPTSDVRHRLFLGDNNTYIGRDLFAMYAENRYHFYNITGETPESLRCLLIELNLRPGKGFKLSPLNRVFLFVIWVRCYPTFAALATMFDISTAIVQVEIRKMIDIFYQKMEHYLKWPTEDEWLLKRGDWEGLYPAVGAIDGTSHQIFKPMTDPQQLFYSGYRKYHAIHTQIVADTDGNICFISSGFPGHLNDAQQFNLMTQIGGDQLPFPDQCILLADKIYPNRYPLMTPYTAQQIARRQDLLEQRKCRKLNRLINSARVCVEHAIGKLKTYSAVSSKWRHSRRLLSRVVKICACLVQRRKQVQ